MALEGLAPSATILAAAVLLDALLGDPRYALHPIRLMGRTLSVFEKVLRSAGCDGYIGGCLLFLLLALTWVVFPSWIVSQLFAWNSRFAVFAVVSLVYMLLALRDLFNHVWRVEKMARNNDLDGTREAIALMVGRDISNMDVAGCRRAAIESLSESFVDGFLSAVFWYAVAGLPGLLLFKVASTMDSMVGYKTSRYLRFGWCGARLDDVMNYVPARLAWILLSLAGSLVPGCSARKGWRIGFEQHAAVPGPNAGWSEATIAGVLQRKLIGPIWKEGALVTSLWLGDSADPEGGKENDVTKAMTVVVAASLLAVLAAMVVLL
jgi:adenosylcobinamide-phosphate synthase